VDLTPPTSSAIPPRNLWQRIVRDPIVKQLTQGITPEKLGLTVAVGSACALFPILGTTTVLCLLVAIALKLNQPIIQLLNQALWPVHLWTIYVCVRLGEMIYRVPHVSFSPRHMKELLWNSPGQFFHQFGSTILCAVTAWLVLAPFFIVIVYYVLLPLLRGIARVRAQAAKPDTLP
jgi:uncharacterized protein (DUF2062 family)